MLTRFRAAGLLWPTLACVPALALLIGLGVWQWQRMAWKTAIVAQIEARAKQAPLSFQEALNLRCNTGRAPRNGREAAPGIDCEYLRVRLRGAFIHNRERHLFAGVVGKSGSELGYWVFTPFQLDIKTTPGDSTRPVVVNRGFIPDRLKRVRVPESEPQTDMREIVVQIRRSELRGWFDANNDTTRNVYYVRNPRELVSAAGKIPSVGPAASIRSWIFYFEEVGAKPADSYPRPLAGTIAIPNRHFEYALTWWGLAATLVGVFIAFAWTRMRSAG